MNIRTRTAFTLLLTLTLTITVYAQEYYVLLGAFKTSEDAGDFKTFVDTKLSDPYTPGSSSEFQVYLLQANTEEEASQKFSALKQNILSQHGQRVDFEPAQGELAKANAPRAVAEENDSKTLMASGAGTSAKEEPLALKPKGKFFKFTVSAPTGIASAANVHFVDYERGRELASFATDTYVDILRPGDNNFMPLVCDAFGYKVEEKLVDYTDPSTTPGAYLDDNGAWIIPYTLVPMERGDVSVMYDLTFYKDAVVMLPTSKEELDQLVTLMKLNPGYEITVHAHCNGKKSRKIISLGEQKNYFNVNGSNEVKGSAKELTTMRAEAVKGYLLENGIDAKRIKTYSWGGSFMLVDEHSPSAKMNDRIEIEIRRD